MTFKELNMFVNVVNCSNLTELSKSLNISQPHISITIKSLEKKLNENLFDRINKKLILNERGRLFHSEIVPILSKLNDLQKTFLSDKIIGELKIGSTNTLSIYFLPQILYKYKMNHPGVTLKCFSENGKILLNMVEEGKIDIAFIESEVSSANIIKEILGKDELVVVSSDKSLANNSYYIDQLFDKDWVIRERTSGIMGIFFNYVNDLRDSMNIVLELPHTLSIKYILKAYPNTISCLSWHSVEQEVRSNELYVIDIKNINFNRNFYLIYHKNKFHNSIFKSFKNFVKRQ